MLDILKIIFPALLVLLMAYLLLQQFFKNEERKRFFERSRESSSAVLPLRLQAYERLALLLERTSLNTLILNTIKPNMTCIELQTQILETVRNEFAHNAAQQIYVSNDLWKFVSATQETVIQLVNGCAGKVQPQSDASVLAELLINVYASSGATPSEVAMNLLKNEIRTLF
ncbi:MAG: hypothetical protein LBN23_06390 [Paludibacter sp.]|jgi:hypothetical protein|nr:hypothetical protein [Paludibacter sp.]